MTSRLPARNAMQRQQRKVAALAARQLELTRSASTVARSAALAAAQQVNEALVSVITKGYVADSQLGEGLGRPLLAMPIQPVADVPTFATCGPAGWERETVSTAFETLFAHAGVRQNVCWAPVLSVRASDATTAGEVQFVDLATGVPLVEALSATSVYAILAGTTVDTVLAPAAPGLLLPQDYGSQIHLGVQARTTAGAGTLIVAVTQSIGG